EGPTPSSGGDYTEARPLAVMLRPEGSPAHSTGGGQIGMIQTAVAMSALGAKVAMLEGAPSILFADARFVDGYTVSGRRSVLGDAIGIVRTLRRTRSNCIYAFTDFFPETMVPSFIAAAVTRRRLFVNITNTAHAADDGRVLLGLLMSRVKRGPVDRSLVGFAAFHLSRRAAFRTGTCLATNRFIEAYSKSRLRAPQVSVVGAGVEDFWYEKKEVPKAYDGVYVGRFDRSKRVPTLIRAWQRVTAVKPDSRLLLVGESGEDFAMVKRMVDELNLTPSVSFAGFIGDRRRLADMVRSARVFVFPSVHEGFGLVIAEAMAAGLPCVLSDVEPLREVFGEAAILVKGDQPPLFAEAVLGLLLDDERRQKYSERSALLARRFTWEAVARNVLSAMDARLSRV
ncbi:MAG TPA: glycosyltransferase, partial [Nitrososphaerales archaeon]|nr:glycosyltransferase [Nitrososphaerales archaeon]